MRKREQHKGRTPEREETDASLAAERATTDTTFAGNEASVGDKAGAAIDLARRRADNVLKAVRLRSDEAHAGDRVDDANRQKQRAVEDAARAAERVLADSELAGEREQRRRAFAEAVRKERESTDITLGHERVLSDELLAARDALLGTVTHDLRTLVGGIGLNLALLVKDLVVEAERGRRIVKTVEAIERTTERIYSLIDDLADVAGIRAGKLSVSIGSHDAFAVVRDAVADMALFVSGKGIALTTELRGDALVAPFDRDRVLQVIENLVGNAVKFTPSGGRILVRVEPTDAVVRFTVEDTGFGVEAAEVPVIFEAFTQGKNPAPRGLGLGLYISKRIVEAHGGKIWLEKTSKEGGGTGSIAAVTLRAGHGINPRKCAGAHANLPETKAM